MLIERIKILVASWLVAKLPGGEMTGNLPNNNYNNTLIEKDHLGDRSPEKDSYHPDDLFQSRYATPGFKPFS